MRKPHLFPRNQKTMSRCLRGRTIHTSLAAVIWRGRSSFFNSGTLFSKSTRAWATVSSNSSEGCAPAILIILWEAILTSEKRGLLLIACCLSNTAFVPSCPTTHSQSTKIFDTLRQAQTLIDTSTSIISSIHHPNNRPIHSLRLVSFHCAVYVHDTLMVCKKRERTTKPPWTVFYGAPATPKFKRRSTSSFLRYWHVSCSLLAKCTLLTYINAN